VRGDHGRARGGRRREVAGVPEPAHVVAEHRTLGEGGGGHGGARGVHGQRQVEAGPQRRDRGGGEIPLLLRADPGDAHAARTGADLQDVGAAHHEALGLLQEPVEGVVRATVEERVPGPVEDPHHHRPFAQVEAPGAQLKVHGARHAGGRPRPQVGWQGCAPTRKGRRPA
jgi:hypothetical protein